MIESDKDLEIFQRRILLTKEASNFFNTQRPGKRKDKIHFGLTLIICLFQEGRAYIYILKIN